jgi:hypothetical protein
MGGIRLEMKHRTISGRWIGRAECGSCGRLLHLWWVVSVEASVKPFRTSWQEAFPLLSHELVCD